MNKHYILPAIILALLQPVLSCSKEETGTSQESEEYKLLRFSADLQQTKTSVDENGSVSWEEGDEVSLYYLSEGVPKTVTVTAEKSGKSTSFSVLLPAGDNPEYFYAVYPKGAGTLSEEGLLSVNTDIIPDGSFKKAHICTAYSRAEDKSFAFKNVLGIFKARIPAGGIISKDGNDITVCGMEIMAKDPDVYFRGTVNVLVADDKVTGFSEAVSGVQAAEVALTEETRSGEYIYIPALPATINDGFAIRYLSADGTGIPAVTTKGGKTSVIESSTIYPIEDISGKIIWDWYVSPDGSGDGKSAGNPGNTELLQTLIGNTASKYGQWKLNGAVIHLLDGTFTLTEPLNMNCTETGRIRIEGAGAGASIIDGSALTSRVMTCKSSMDIALSGLTVQNSTSSANGGALTFSGTGKLEIDGCRFYNNTSSSGNSGALYLGGTNGHRICGTEFDSNTALTYGGAFCIGGSAAGTTQVENCLFSKNKLTYTTNDTRGSGGAIYVANADLMTVNDCTFESNQCYINGGAIFSNKSGARIFINRSLFVGNSVARSGYGAFGGAITTTAKTAAVGMFNCTFNWNHSSAASSATSALTLDRYIIANSTLVESAKVSYGVITNRAEEDHISTIVNSIVMTTSTTATHPSLSISANDSYNHLDCGYNLVNKIQSGFTAASDDATSYTPCTKTDLGFGDSVDKSGRCYAWNGDTSAFSGYSKCGSNDVENLVKANSLFGTEFWNWLEGLEDENGNKAVEVDVRKVKRTGSWWPGSYQE